MSTFYHLTCKTLRGADFTFDSLRGKVVLIVNVASKCGLTGQYSGLQALYDKYKVHGLEVIAFPSNAFLQQEPGDADTIVACQRNYGVSFPVMEKIEVNGNDASPVYKYLKSQQGNQDVAWNFAKFLVNRKGEVVAHISPKTEPKDIEADIEKLINESNL